MGGIPRLGVVDGKMVREVTEALDFLPAYRYPLPRYDLLIANLDVVRSLAAGIASRAQPVPLAGLKLLSPVGNPGKIIGAPVNYQKPGGTAIPPHGLFLKANSSLVGPGEGIAVRMQDRATDHEVELGVVIGREARNVKAAAALDYVAGYTVALDITLRGTEDKSLRKSPDSYTVLGPWLVTKDEVPSPGELDLKLEVNGETRQSSNTRHMILGVAELIELASSFFTLYPGDVISTGTPEGIGPIVPGDRIVATVERVGAMEVAVRATA